MFYGIQFPFICENEIGFVKLQNRACFMKGSFSLFYFCRKAYGLMEIQNRKVVWKRMSNKPKRRFRGKKNARMKQQILRKERQRATKYPLHTEYRQASLLKRSRERGA